MSTCRESPHRSRVAALIQDAETLAARGCFRRARAAFQTALDSQQDGHAAATARLAFACFLMRRGDHAAAMTHLQHVLSMAVQGDDAVLRSAACNNMAVACREMGEPEMAARWQQCATAWLHAQALPVDAEETARDLANRANDAIAASDLDLAEQLLWRSLLLEQSRESVEGQASDWGSLGLVAGLRGELRTAVRRLGRACRLHAQLGDTRGTGCDLMNLATFLQEAGRWRTAGRLLHQARQHFKQAGAADLVERADLRLREARRFVRVFCANPAWN